MSDIPKATHSGVLKIAGVEMRVYRLDSGQSVIHADDFHAFWQALERGAILNPGDAQKLAEFVKLGVGPDGEDLWGPPQGEEEW